MYHYMKVPYHNRKDRPMSAKSDFRESLEIANGLKSMPSLILESASSLTSTATQIASLVKGRDVSFVAGSSPSFKKRGIRFAAIGAALTGFNAAITSIEIASRNRQTSNSEISHESEPVSDTVLTSRCIFGLVGVTLTARELIRVRSNFKNYPLSKLGFGASLLTLVSGTWALYENGSELYRRIDSKKVSKAFG